METYTLEHTRLELSGGRLLKKDEKGTLEAAFDVRRIKRASIVSSWDTTGVAIMIAFLCLTLGFFYFMPAGLWRWTAVVLSGTIFLICTFGARGRMVVIEIGDDRVEYLATELPDQISSFVAMINQARTEEPQSSTNQRP